ncbi:MAG: hypothetical protein ABH827_06635, partial [bacterium]
LNNLIIVLDRDGQENSIKASGPMWKEMRQGLKSLASCILVSKNVMYHILKDDKDNCFFNDWKICAFHKKGDPSSWSELLLLIPFKYDTLVNQVTKKTSEYVNCFDAGTETDNIRKKRLLLAWLKKMNSTNDIAWSNNITRCMELFVELVEDVSKEDEWYIYLTGHGGKKTFIADLKPKELAELIAFINKHDQLGLFRCGMFFFSSCYIGGVNQKSFNTFLDEHKDVIPYYFRFSIVLGGFEEGITYATFIDFLDFFHKARAIKDCTESKNIKDLWEEFLSFYALTHSPRSEDFHAKSNISLVLFPYGIRFDAININNVLQVIGPVSYQKAKLENKPITISKRRAFFVYPSYLDIVLNLYPEKPLYYMWLKYAPSLYDEVKNRQDYYEQQQLNASLQRLKKLGEEIKNTPKYFFTQGTFFSDFLKEKFERLLNISKADWPIYPAFIPQNKFETVFYMQQVNACFSVGIMQCVRDLFFDVENDFLIKRTLLIQTLTGANDLLGLLSLSRYQKYEKTPKDYWYSHAYDLEEMLLGKKEETLTLKNVVLSLSNYYDCSISFEYGDKAWSCDTRIDKWDWRFFSKDKTEHTTFFDAQKKECSVRSLALSGDVDAYETIVEKAKNCFAVDDLNKTIEYLNFFIENKKDAYIANVLGDVYEKVVNAFKQEKKDDRKKYIKFVCCKIEQLPTKYKDALFKKLYNEFLKNPISSKQDVVKDVLNALVASYESSIISSRTREDRKSYEYSDKCQDIAHFLFALLKENNQKDVKAYADYIFGMSKLSSLEKDRICHELYAIAKKYSVQNASKSTLAIAKKTFDFLLGYSYNPFLGFVVYRYKDTYNDFARIVKAFLKSKNKKIMDAGCLFFDLLLRHENSLASAKTMKQYAAGSAEKIGKLFVLRMAVAFNDVALLLKENAEDAKDVVRLFCREYKIFIAEFYKKFSESTKTGIIKKQLFFWFYFMKNDEKSTKVFNFLARVLLDSSKLYVVKSKMKKVSDDEHRKKIVTQKMINLVSLSESSKSLADFYKKIKLWAKNYTISVQ